MKIKSLADILHKKRKNFRRGSEIIEVTLIVAISIVLVISIFYPKIVSLSNGAMATLSDWFRNAVSTIGNIA